MSGSGLSRIKLWGITLTVTAEMPSSSSSPGMRPALQPPRPFLFFGLADGSGEHGHSAMDFDHARVLSERWIGSAGGFQLERDGGGDGCLEQAEEEQNGENWEFEKERSETRIQRDTDRCVSNERLRVEISCEFGGTGTVDLREVVPSRLP